MDTEVAKVHREDSIGKIIAAAAAAAGAMGHSSNNSSQSSTPDLQSANSQQHEQHQLKSASTCKRIRPKKYQCPHCWVALSNTGQYRGHMRIHTGERPFQCDCGKSFTRNEELTRHKRIHTGLRPYACPICNKCFGRKDHLKKHTRTHEKGPAGGPHELSSTGTHELSNSEAHELSNTSGNGGSGGAPLDQQLDVNATTLAFHGDSPHSGPPSSGGAITPGGCTAGGGTPGSGWWPCRCWWCCYRYPGLLSPLAMASPQGGYTDISNYLSAMNLISNMMTRNSL